MELSNYLFYFQKLNNNNIFYSFRYNVVKKVEKENNVHHYLVVGRHAPTEKNKNPKIYKMRIFADDPVRAKCKFWYFLKKLDKVKKASGQILACHEIFEKDPSKVKTFVCIKK